MWALTGKAEGREPLIGVPWRDMSDAEFRRVAREYADRNDFPRRALHGSGYFEHIPDDGTSEPDEDPEEETPAAGDQEVTDGTG